MTGMVDETMRAFGAVRILVNHAGASGIPTHREPPRGDVGGTCSEYISMVRFLDPGRHSRHEVARVGAHRQHIVARRLSNQPWRLAGRAVRLRGGQGRDHRLQPVAAAELGTWGITVNVIAPWIGGGERY